MTGDRYVPVGEQRISLGVWPLLKARRFVLGLGLFLIVINRMCSLALPYSTKFLIDDVLTKHRHELLLPIVGGVLLATLIQVIADFSATQVIERSGQRLIAQWRCIVQNHVGRLPVSFFDANTTGALVSRVMSDLEGLRTIAGSGLVEFIGAILAAVMALFVMTHISVLMTGIAVGIIVAFGLFAYKSLHTLQAIFKHRAYITAEVAGRLNESLAGVRVIKSYRAEDREAAVFASGMQRFLAISLRLLTRTSSISAAATLLVGIVGASVGYIGIHQVSIGAMTLGGFVTFTTMMAFLVAPVFRMVSLGSQMSEALAGMERTRELLAMQREDEDPQRTLCLGPPRACVEFKDVSFAYHPGKNVLSNISFVASPGTVTAIVGPSGAGKSTLISLVLAAHCPATGKIMVDGIDISTIRLDSYREHLGVVLQDSFLFDGSIRDNIAFSRPSAADEDIHEASRLARVDEFVETFAQQYNTQVGERGTRLSGGQRQRVSIARAILANPKILILDEATSSLDAESEAFIRQALSNVMRGRTTFVIAHRFSTIRNADQIIVLDQGRIVESGTHDKLYASGGRYFALYKNQESIETDRLPTSAAGLNESPKEETPPAEMVNTPSFMKVASLF